MKHSLLFLNLTFLVVLLLLLGGFFLRGEWGTSPPSANETATVVVRIIDLDTLELANSERVRLLCVNAPEREQPWTTAAMKEMSDFLVGKDVVLVRDISDRDAYGRLLRHVYLEDGTWIEEYLVRQGFARIAPFEPDSKFCEGLRNAVEEAQLEGRGIWAAKIPICDRDFYECDDFSGQAQATALFAACGGPSNDIHYLDGDKDGEVCEELV